MYNQKCVVSSILRLSKIHNVNKIPCLRHFSIRKLMEYIPSFSQMLETIGLLITFVAATQSINPITALPANTGIYF